MRYSALYHAILHVRPRDDALACFVTWRLRFALWRRYDAAIARYLELWVNVTGPNTWRFSSESSLACMASCHFCQSFICRNCLIDLGTVTSSFIISLDRMQAARDRQKSYADKRRRPLEFEVGDKVMLKVAPWKGVMRFRKHGKLNPRYIGPFRIIERIGLVAYHLELPQELSRVYNVFHIYNLKKCLSNDTLVISLEEIQLDDKLNFVEEPVEIMDREVKQLKQSRIPIIKVCWNARRGPEYTWEREDQFREKYPHLFTNPRSTTTS
ncbi:hypothetical protein Tco_0995608 [Tanacetum coccineum]